MSNQKSQRLLSLDVLRGITIAGMILVNNPGSWSDIYAPLRHADWHGLTPTDLVFPFFMFIMGISTYISLRKTNFEYSTPIFFKILKRTLVIFLIGLGLSWVSLSINTYYSLAEGNLSMWSRLLGAITNFENLRILGVMQRLALTYGACSLVAIFIKHRNIPFVIAGILVAYFAILLFGNGFEKGDTNILAIIDQSVLGINHIYNEHGLDPEGLLSTLPSIAHVLIGFYFGKLLMEMKDNYTRILKFLIYGTILMFVGLLFSYACPINKRIWSPTYVLVTCGMVANLLALLIWIIDVKGYKKWSVFFESFGANPLFIYVFASLFATFIGSIRLSVGGSDLAIKEYIVGGMLSLGMNADFTSCLFAILFVVICWIMGHNLYKRNIYIKI